MQCLNIIALEKLTLCANERCSFFFEVRVLSAQTENGGKCSQGNEKENMLAGINLLDFPELVGEMRFLDNSPIAFYFSVVPYLFFHFIFVLF